MQALIFSAGFGKRLGPLTEKTPKPLLTVGGVSLLEIAIRRLIKARVSSIVINTHYKADQIKDFISQKSFGVPIRVSHEEEILETGGGLKNAARFLEDGAPFFIHNADVLSRVDLKSLYQFHLDSKGALATLSVRQRLSSRFLLFEEGRLCGYQKEGKTRSFSKSGEFKALAFDGIHVVSPRIFSKIKEVGKFSIIDLYLRLAEEGENIQAFLADSFAWRDVGNSEDFLKGGQEAPFWLEELS
jgi:NDP-sugar pyrophosphorylase family protein